MSTRSIFGIFVCGSLLLLGCGSTDKSKADTQSAADAAVDVAALGDNQSLVDVADDSNTPREDVLPADAQDTKDVGFPDAKDTAVPDLAADVPLTDSQDTAVADLAVDVPLPDSALPDVPVTPGEVTVTGTLALSAAITAVDEGGYIVVLLPPNYVLGGDPVADIIAAAFLPAGLGYTGALMAVPVGTKLMKWNPDGGGPSEAYLAAPGPYTVLVVFMPIMGSNGDPTHVWVAQKTLADLPGDLALGDLVLEPSGGPQ